MRTPTVGTMTLLGLVAAMSTAPAAFAQPTESPSTPTPSPEIFITGDGRPQPGDDIGVVVRCGYGHPGKPQSPVLEIGKLEKVDSPSGIDTYQAAALIRPDTEPGDYPLSARCGKNGLRTTFTVYPADPGEGDGDDGEATDPGAGTGGGDDEDRQVTRTPKGAPETGGEPDADLAPLFWGAGLVGVAGLGSVVARRAVRR